MGIGDVVLADTTGMADPCQVIIRVGEVFKRWPNLSLSLQFHNTRGMGLANVMNVTFGGKLDPYKQEHR